MKPLPRAFTLIGLLFVLATAATLATAAVPVFRGWLLEARMVSAVNDLVHAIHLARVAAISEAREVVLCRSTDARQCAAAGDWTSGWLVFVNVNGGTPPMVDPGERLLAARGPLQLASISSNRTSYTLRPHARRATNGTLVVCDQRGPAAARAVIISYSGRPRVSRQAANGSALTCPG